MPDKTNKKSVSKPGKRKQNKTLFWIIGAVFVVAVAAMIVFREKPNPYTPEVTGGPSLQTDQQNIDLGNQKLGTTVNVTFNIKNVGDKLLVFTEAPYIEVKEGCCPSSPTIGSKTLKPGESTTLTFPMMMHAGMGGYHDFRVHIPNNDPKNYNFEFVVLSNWVD
jgi:hypothetical protein